MANRGGEQLKEKGSLITGLYSTTSRVEGKESVLLVSKSTAAGVCTVNLSNRAGVDNTAKEREQGVGEEQAASRTWKGCS